MTRDLNRTLSTWLEGSPTLQIGEISIRKCGAGFHLSHTEDADRDDLVTHTRAEDARELGTLDDEGQYRPLKTAPNLRHGWRMILGDVAALRRALDAFYPAMLGILADRQAGILEPVTLRDTLGRQSGMYAVTRKLTDGQAQTMIGGFCTSDGGCLKIILWKIAQDLPIHSLPAAKCDPEAGLRPASGALPMLCHEACNLLVAKAREVVKTAPPSA